MSISLMKSEDLKMSKSKDEVIMYKLISYRMPTPDGTMFVNINEDDERNFVKIEILVGKAGTSLRAYLQVLSAFITVMIKSGVSIYRIIEILSNQRTDRIAYLENGRTVSSGAEALFIILTNYNSEKVAELESGNGIHKQRGYFTKKREKRA